MRSGCVQAEPRSSIVQNRAKLGKRFMNIKVGREAVAEASKKLSNWGRWGKDDHIGTLNHVKPGGHRQRRHA